MSSQRIFFENEKGIRLCGILEAPDSKPLATGIFSHCFTCNKDLKAIVRISRNLAKVGFAILRFDFTGLGNSQGNFSDSVFDDNLLDIAAANSYLSKHHSSPSLLIGHSLGGAAMMKISKQLPHAKALVTIAAPCSTRHLADYLAKSNPAIIEKGEGEVEIGGRRYLLKKALIENLRSHDLETSIREIRIPHLIFHPPEDTTLPFWHAEKLFELSGGDRAFITLRGSDHLLVSNKDDVRFVADTISSWYRRSSSTGTDHTQPKRQ